jgi:hypothetical protein
VNGTKNLVAERSGAPDLERESARLGSEKRCRPSSAWSPPSWKKFGAKHREAPTISLDPPGNEPDVTQNGKGRQCVSAGKFLRRTWRCRCNLHDRWIWIEACDRKSGGKTAALHKKKNALALAISCGRLAAFTAPPFRIQGCMRCRSGEGREFPSGGRATWASFFWSSSG